MEANANPGPDQIGVVVPGPYPLDLAGTAEDAATTGDLDVADDVAIIGVPGVAIDATGLGDRVFDLLPGATVSMEGITITGGSSVASGGGIESEAEALTLTGVAVEANSASLEGGGLMVIAGTATVTDSTITNNGTYGAGAGIASRGTLLVDGSTVSSNTAGYAGGVFTHAGIATITDARITGNSAVIAGGGAVLFAPTTIDGSTVDNNTSDIAGGLAIAYFDQAITNSTITANTATTVGGGIVSTTPTLTLHSVTIAGNAAPSGANVGLDHLGGYDSYFASVPNAAVTFINTIIANPLGGGTNCTDLTTSTITSGGYNLDSDTTCGLAGTADQVLVDPLLGPLTDNGGPTPTMAPGVGSPAIDTGTTTLTVDQNNTTRPTGAGDDIGAVEQ